MGLPPKPCVDEEVARDVASGARGDEGAAFWLKPVILLVNSAEAREGARALCRSSASY
jgi:hypothetical protein